MEMGGVINGGIDRRLDGKTRARIDVVMGRRQVETNR